MASFFSSIWVTYEIYIVIFFVLLLLYIGIYEVYRMWKNVSKTYTERAEKRAEILRTRTENREKIASTPVVHATKNEYIPPVLSPTDVENMQSILAQARTRIARGERENAMNSLTEGLSIDKNNKELNMLLATLYERSDDYKKAELVYKDMVSIYPDDIDILEKLAKTLTKLDKHTIAYEVYKKLLPISLHPDDVLYILANTAGIIMKPIESAMYAKMYLKNHPHNAEMLWIHAQDCIENGDRIQAIEILTKLVRLSPYNGEIQELMQKIKTEEELAGNFGG